MSGRSVNDLDGDYAKAGFGAGLGFGKKPALIIIDFAMAYLVPDSPLFAGVEAELESNIRLAEAARAAHIPVVFTKVEYQANGVDGGYFYRKVRALQCFDAGNPLGEFHPRLTPQPGDILVVKQYPSAFFGTTLASTLRALGVDTCVVTGLSTSGCVRATALDALQHGFIPVVVRDACGDRDARVQEANLFDLRAKYADVISEAETLGYLDGLLSR
jgi:maleamate amidohydrolase